MPPFRSDGGDFGRDPAVDSEPSDKLRFSELVDDGNPLMSLCDEKSWMGEPVYESVKVSLNEDFDTSVESCSLEGASTPSGTRTPTTEDETLPLCSAHDLVSTPDIYLRTAENLPLCSADGLVSTPDPLCTAACASASMGLSWLPYMVMVPANPPCTDGLNNIPQRATQSRIVTHDGTDRLDIGTEHGSFCTAQDMCQTPTQDHGPREDQLPWCIMAMPAPEGYGLQNGTPFSEVQDSEINPLQFLYELEYQRSGHMSFFDGCNYNFPDGWDKRGWDCSNFAPLTSCFSHAYVPKVTDFRSRFEMEQLGSENQITTLMIRNIPNRCTRKVLMDELDYLGFQGTYDFIYVPTDKGTRWNVGYAFVNFMESASAQRCIERLTNYRFRRFGTVSGKMTQVSAAHIQGLEKNLEHYSRTAVQNARIQTHRPLVVRSSKNGLDQLNKRFGCVH